MIVAYVLSNTQCFLVTVYSRIQVKRMKHSKPKGGEQRIRKDIQLWLQNADEKRFTESKVSYTFI